MGLFIFLASAVLEIFVFKSLKAVLEIFAVKVLKRGDFFRKILCYKISEIGTKSLISEFTKLFLIDYFVISLEPKGLIEPNPDNNFRAPYVKRIRA